MERMMKTSKSLMILAIMAFALFSSCKAFAVNLEITTSQSDTSTYEGVVDQSGTLLPRFSGYWVQIIKTSTGSINPPDKFGDPTNGDVVIASVEVGDGFVFGPNGNFDTELSIVNSGDILYCRAFNTPSPSTATYYGNSEIYTVQSYSPQTWNINGSADTPAFATNMSFDTTPPVPPTSLVVSPEISGDLFVSWTPSTSPDDAGTRIIIRTDRSATSEFDYSGATYEDISAAAAQALRDTGLLNGVKYYFTIFSYDTSNNFSTGVSSSETAFDLLPPAVSTTEPISGRMDADPSTTISVTFNDTMNASNTINAFHIIAQNGASVSGSGALSPLNKFVFTPSANLVGNVTYTCTVDTTATDKAGNPLPARYTWQFRTAGAIIAGIPPFISNIKFDGWGAKTGDFIAPRPRITADITDPLGFGNISSVEVLLDSTVYYYGNDILSAVFSAGFMSFLPTSSMTSGTHTVTVRAWNWLGLLTEESIAGLQIAGGELRIIGQFVNYPAEVDSGKGTTFAYTLSAPSDIQLYIYGIGGIVLKKVIASGTPGGMAGYNEVYWDGLSGIGHPLGNGMYIVIVAAGDKRLGKLNLIINNSP
jgi:Bacterial Ig-like domain